MVPISSFNQISLPKKTNSRINLIFKPLKLHDSYIYELEFSTTEIGGLKCFIEFEYPKEEIVAPLVLHVNSGEEVLGTLQFINNFCKSLELEI